MAKQSEEALELSRHKIKLKEQNNLTDDFFAYLKTWEKLGMDETQLMAELHKTFINLYFDDFSIVVDDIMLTLGVSDMFVRSQILPHLRHFQAPLGTGELFKRLDGEYDPDDFKDVPNLEHFEQLPFLRKRILKWKKVFISSKSFEEYLQENLTMYVKASTYTYNKEKERYEGVEYDHEITDMSWLTLEFIEKNHLRLIRRVDLKEHIKPLKFDALIRKTSGDLYMKQEYISAERYHSELKELSQVSINDVLINVQDFEIERFLKANSESCVKFVLNNMTTRTNANVFYWFFGDKINTFYTS